VGNRKGSTQRNPNAWNGPDLMSTNANECSGKEIISFLLHMNELTIMVGGLQVTAKVDSGADLNFISKSLFDKLPVNIRRKFKKNVGTCKVANEGKIQMLGDLVLPFDVRGQRISAQCKVLSGCSSEVFLGLPFLEQHSATLKFTHERNTLSLLISVPVVSEEFCTVEPYSERLAVGVARGSEIKDKTTGYCFPFTSLMSKGLLTAHMAVSVSENKLPVRLYNTTRKKIEIKKGERIGTFRVFDGAEDLSPYDVEKPELNDISVPNHVNTCDDETRKGDNIDPTLQPPFVDLEGSSLEPDEKVQLRKLLNEFPDCFVCPPDNKLGLTDMAECKIEVLPGTIPVSKYCYRQPPIMREAMGDIIKDQLKRGLIEESNDGEWASPALLVKKSSGDYRLVIDYRGLNAATIPQRLRIPRIDEVFDTIGEQCPKYFSVLDCTQGFHQVPLHPDSRDKTAFISHMGKYRYCTMPQGTRNSPVVFQSLMDRVLRGIQFKYVMVYIDDICIFSSTFEEHLNHIREVLTRIRKAKLKLHPKKCKFALREVHYLGHVLTPDGIKPNDDKISAILDCPVPTKVRQVRGFLGMAGYYRKFIPGFGIIARPLYHLTKKNEPFNWTTACQDAFDCLKQKLVSHEVLIFPRFKEKFYLCTDASNGAIGACLSQKVDGHLRPIAYAGRSFNSAEAKYKTTEQECLAVVWAVQHFRVYLECAETEVHTDHSALQWILKEKHSTGRLCRWALMLQSFNLDIKHIKGRDNVVADQLSRRSYDYTHTRADEAIDNYPDLDNIKSEFVPGKNKPAVPTLNALEKRQAKFKPIMRESAEKLINSGTALFTKEEYIKQQHNDKSCKAMIDYKEKGTIPEDEADINFVARKAEDFIIEEGVLLRMQTPGGQKPTAFATVVVPQNLKLQVLRFCHDSLHGGHVGAQKMCGRMRQLFFWDGMSSDIRNYVQTCPACQASKPSHRPIVPPMTEREVVGEAFDTVVIDTTGPFHKSRGYKHIVCVIDQYSRWVIAWPTKAIDAYSIVLDFNKHVVCKFGTPRRVLCDNGPCFASQMFKAQCNLHNIKLSHGSPYHSKTQSQVERTHQTVVSLIRTYCNELQTNWADFLDEIVCALNFTESQANGMIPFLMIYGRLPPSPATLNIPEAYGEVNQPAAQKFAGYLARKEECKKYAANIEAKYRLKMKKRYDENKATQVKLKPGDCVWMRYATAIVKDVARKLQKRYHGPYMILEFVGETNVLLYNVTKKRLMKKAIHIDRLKMGHMRRELNSWDPEEVFEEPENVEAPSPNNSPQNTPTNTPLSSPRGVTVPIVSPTLQKHAEPQTDTHMSVYKHNESRKATRPVTRAMTKIKLLDGAQNK